MVGRNAGPLSPGDPGKSPGASTRQRLLSLLFLRVDWKDAKGTPTKGIGKKY